MLRNLLCASLMVALSFGLAMAEPVKGKITRIEGDKITFIVAPKEKGQKGEVKTFELEKGVKVVKMDKKNKVEVAGGLKADALQSIDAKGIGATLEVNGGKVSEIILGAAKKKKN